MSSLLLILNYLLITTLGTVLTAVSDRDLNCPAPFFKPIVPDKYGTIARTSTVITRSVVDEQLNDPTKKTTSPLNDLLKIKKYKQFIKQNENIFGITNDKKKNLNKDLTKKKLKNLYESIHLLHTECYDNTRNETHYFMGTGIAINSYLIMTASHNIDCEYVNKNYSFKLIYRSTLKEPLKILYDGVPHIDDVLILTSSDYMYAYIPLKVNNSIKSMDNSAYKNNTNYPILCIGYVGNTQSMYLKDGKTVNRKELDTIYGSSGEIIASFGLIKSFHELLDDTCNYMTSQISAGNFDTNKCRDYYFHANSKIFSNISAYGFAHNANIIEGMSGGICVDAYNPLLIMAVNSLGADNIIKETNPDGTIITHHHSVCNYATLITHSNSYKQYSSWWYYYDYYITTQLIETDLS